MASSDAGAAVRENTQHAALRLDPWQLPVTSTTRQTRKGGDGTAAIETTVSTEGVVIKRELDSGLPLTLSMPNDAFQGVSALVTDHDDGSSTVVVKLHHHDPQLSVTVLETADMDEAAAYWQAWSRRMGLPMLLVSPEGKAELVREPGGLTSRAPKARRRRVSAVKRRPTFLRRRHVGVVGPVVQLPMAELIARS